MISGGPRERSRHLPVRIIKGADAILFSEAIAAEGQLVFAKAREMGFEGIVSKRVGSIYWSGRAGT
jgi:ATP-dependent DNA ligase